jgi:hypothetical protein
MYKSFAELPCCWSCCSISGSPAFTSGFLGVDVFFVISGYLMAVMYDPSKKAEFFAKRARRLLPAYLATILATLLVAIIVTAPNDFQWIFKPASFAAVFAPNFAYLGGLGRNRTDRRCGRMHSHEMTLAADTCITGTPFRTG